MGIVVCVGMLVALLGLVPRSRLLTSTAGLAVAGLIFLLGVWNAGWYGAQHLTQFWGQAALGSGVCMILGASLIIARSNGSGWLAKVAALLMPLRWAIIIGLAMSFLLYFYALVQLNLGVEVIGLAP